MTYILPALFWIAQGVFVPLFIRSGWPKTKRSSLYIKMVCSSVFVLFCLYMLRLEHNTAYGTHILFGLVCGWIGDVFMTLEPFLPQGNKTANTLATVVGGVAFLAGHIFYITSFLSVGNAKGILLPVLFAGTFLALVIAKLVLHLHFEKLTIPVALYAMMVSLLFASGLAAGISLHSGRGILVLGVSTFLFLLSDMTLGLKAFAPRFNTLPVRAVYISTYYIAQMLLVHSIALVG